MKIAAFAVGLLASLAAAQAPPPAGRYVAALPAADSPGRQLTLSLTPEGSASLTTDFKNGKPPIVESGTWGDAGAGRIALTLTRRGTRQLPAPDVLNLSVAGDTLTAIDLDQARWGSVNVSFVRDTAGGLIGGTWQLTHIVKAHDQPIAPKDPSSYTVRFNDDRTLAVRADCNRGRGTYSTEESRLRLGPIATTRMMCQRGSLDTLFLKALSGTVTFTIEDGELQIAGAQDLALAFDRIR
jgi:heat shock protein HslJ